MNTTNAWYIRKQSGGEIKGPFPAGQISQEMLLGRHKLDDEVSHDKEEWQKIRDVKELVPDIFYEDREDPAFKQKLAAARRWADERRGVDDIDEKDDRRSSGSSYESKEIKRLHRLATEAKKENKTSAFVQLGLVFLTVIVLITLAFQYAPVNEDAIDCNAPAKQAINWSGCNLSGAQMLREKLVAANLMNANLQTANLYASDLSHANLKFTQLHLSNLKYVNLSKANLTGASLMGADLTGANLSQADLSYANFRDAKIESVDFTKARLNNAIWIDGRTCRADSVGACN